MLKYCYSLPETSVFLKSALTLCLSYDNWDMYTIQYLPFFVLYIVDKTYKKAFQ